MKITNTFEYKPTIDELAKEIWDLDDSEQLKLLSVLSAVSDSYHIAMQMEYMRDAVAFNKGNDDYRNAKNFVAYLNDYFNGERVKLN